MFSSTDLKHDWLTPIAELKYRPTIHPFDKLCRVIGMAEWFVTRWADWAELAHMTPEHLFRYDEADLLGRGLAWRWTDCMDVLVFPRARTLVAESLGGVSDTLFVYYFHPDGRTTHIFGEERRDILKGIVDIEALPTLRQVYAAGDFE